MAQKALYWRRRVICSSTNTQAEPFFWCVRCRNVPRPWCSAHHPPCYVTQLPTVFKPCNRNGCIRGTPAYHQPHSLRCHCSSLYGIALLNNTHVDMDGCEEAPHLTVGSVVAYRHWYLVSYALYSLYCTRQCICVSVGAYTTVHATRHWYVLRLTRSASDGPPPPLSIRLPYMSVPPCHDSIHYKH